MKKTLFSNVKAVIFDFDGTLAVLNIDFGFMREQVFGLIRQFGIQEESIRQKHALEIIDEVFTILSQENPSAAGNFYERAHDILRNIEMEAAGEGKLLPRVEETLADLRKKGIKVGIVTRNCADAVRRVFPKIDDFCDVFVSRDFVKKVKPHPEHLTTAMSGLNVSGPETLMVGDHLLDIHAGKRVGTKTIGVLTGSTKRGDFEQAEADFVLDDASGLCVLLNKWLEQEKCFLP